MGLPITITSDVGEYSTERGSGNCDISRGSEQDVQLFEHGVDIDCSVESERLSPRLTLELLGVCVFALRL